ncbi:MAG: hypothetical protein LBP90_01965 [Burkholderiales bacterium]|nr:hypothetical protein [Burkholderiales bacterium]
MVFAFSGLASAATIIVTNTNDTGAGSLRAAIAAANAGDTIVFSGLPANPTITLAGELTVNKSLIIDGSDAPGLAVSGNNAVRVFSVLGGTTVEFKDFTIKEGAVTGGGLGGGIYNEGTLTLTNSTVSGNTTDRSGGGIHNDVNATLTLTNSTVSGNTTTDYGGGIFNGVNATLTLTNSTVSDNTATDGGGIRNWGEATLTNSTVSGNTANWNGGGILNHSNATLTLINSTVSGNTASWGGGIYNDFDTTLTLTNSTVSGNTATSAGGGILNIGAATLTNSTVFGNTDNGAYAGCGGLCNAADATNQSTATLANTIVQSCYIESAAPPATLTDNGGNLDGGTGCGFTGASKGNANLNLGALANNGGATWTRMPGAGSDAIGYGVWDTCSNAATVNSKDQRGVTRSPPCTSGAVEVVKQNPPIGSATPVPALGFWALLWLGIFTAGAAATFLRRR